MESSAVALRAAPLTKTRRGGQVVGWIRRGERVVVVRRLGTRVQCRLATGRLGWASIATSTGGTPLLRLREGGERKGEQLSLRGQRSQESLGSKSDTDILLHRVAVSPYEPPPTVNTSKQPITDVLSIVKQKPQSERQRQWRPSSRPASAAISALATLRAAHIAAADGNLSAVRRIVQEVGEEAVRTPDVGDGRMMLHHAAGSGQLEVVQYLLEECSAPPNAPEIGGETPLMHAAACAGPLAHLCAATLIASGADHKSIDARQREALHHAAFHGNSAVLRILLGAGAGPGGRSVPLGRTPLHMAAENNHPVCVQLLLDGHADVDARTTDGMTPIHCAAWRGALGPIQLLLRAGADASVRTQEGHTALDLSAAFGRQQCAQLLQSAGMPPPTVDGEYDLEMFATPQQLIEDGLVVPLSDRVVAGLKAVESCLDQDGGAGSQRELRTDDDSTSRSKSSERLRPLSAKSKAVSQLLTVEDYERSKQGQQQTDGGDVTCDQENKNPDGNQAQSSLPNGCDDLTGSFLGSVNGTAAQQRSSPALMHSGMQTQVALPARRRPQTASAAVQQRVHLAHNRQLRKNKPASAGPARRASAGPKVLSMQGTVRSATLGWGMHEWEQATSQFKLAPTPAVQAGNIRAASSISELRQAVRQTNSSVTLPSTSDDAKEGSEKHKQLGAKQRPHSAAAVPTRPWSSLSCSRTVPVAQHRPLDGLSITTSSTRRPSSAIPTTTQYQPPGVEEAAAHYLTTAQRMKRQEARLSLCKQDSVALQATSNNSDSHIVVDVGIPSDLSLFHSETREEREERTSAETKAATQIQAIVRGWLGRQAEQ